MKTNDKNSKESKNVKCRISEIHEAIDQIKIHLSEIDKSDESQSIRYLVQSATHESKKYLELFEWHLQDLSDLFT